MRSRLAIGCAFLAALLLYVPSVSAQGADDETMKQARAAYAEGAKLYEAGKKKDAAQKFKLAYRLTRNAVLLYNIGLIHDELQDHPIALHYYKKFVKDAPDDETTKDNRALANERITTISAEIAAEEAAEAEEVKEQDLKVARKESKRITEFTHRIIDQTPKDLPIDVVAKIPRRARWSLTLYYRSGGASGYDATRMVPRFLENVGRIPKDAVTGTAVQYYIEVKDRKGKLLATSGRASSPNVIYLDNEADPHYYQDLSERGSTKMVRADAIAYDESKHEPKRGDGKSMFDIRGQTMQTSKWVFTGTAAAMFTTSVVALILAKSAGSQLEAEAIRSGRMETCGATPPCTEWSTQQRDLQSKGESLETMTNVTLGIGLATATVAGVIWYLDLKDKAKQERLGSRMSPRFMAVPVVGDGFVGGAAHIDF